VLSQKYYYSFLAVLYYRLPDLSGSAEAIESYAAKFCWMRAK